MLGILMAVGSAVFGGVSLLFAKRVIDGIDPFAATQIRILAALFCYPPLLTLMRRWGQVGKAMQNMAAMKILLLGTIVGPFLGMALYMFAIKACPSTGIVCTISSIAPVMILPFCILVYKEKVSPRAAFGAVVSVLGIAVMIYKPASLGPHSISLGPSEKISVPLLISPAESVFIRSTILLDKPAAIPSINRDILSGFDDANPDFFQPGKEGAIGRGIGDERGPVIETAEFPERGLPQLRPVGNDEHAAGGSGHLREHPRQFGRFLINIPLSVDAVSAQKSYVRPQGLKIRLGESASQVRGRRA
jgi:uncharacterized membrane protein